MNQIKFLLLWVAMLTMSMSNCGENQNEISPDDLQNESCFTGEIVKSVKDQKGTIYYNSSEKEYAVHMSIQGSYDSQYVGFICNKLDTLKKDGLSITFSGNYFSYKKDRVPPVAGLTYYFLDITNFKINK